MTCIAITGATGFIGRHLLDAFVASGIDIRALTRRPQAPRTGVTWVAGDLDNRRALRELAHGADLVIHAAGLVKARRAADFDSVNRGGTARLLAALDAAAPAARLVLVSSLAAREPQLSPYAASKAAAEALVAGALPESRRIILRPPGVYGPGDREILKLIRAAARGVLPVPGRTGNRVSLVYAPDLARLVAALCAGTAHGGRVIEVDDGRSGGYDYAEIADILSGVLGRPVRPLAVPAPALHGLAMTAELVAFLSRRPAMLGRGKVRELLHPDWVVRDGGNDILRLVPETATDLATGLGRSCAWARDQGLL
ncbi:MAG: NAD-dependent epimerase/dehydratase family protein [Rhodothalassiaceae bacterium]